MLIKKVKKAVERFLLFILRRRDPLTGLLDRSALKSLNDKRLKKEKVALIFMDLDNFKEINDCLGHQLGDIFLKDFADLLTREVRSRDLAIRWGGDEFLVCLFDADKNDGLSFLKRIKTKTERLDITRRSDFLKLEKKVQRRNFCEIDELKEKIDDLTVAGGVAEVEDNIFEAVAIADGNMYKDKEKKRTPETKEILPLSENEQRKELISILKSEVGKKKAQRIIKRIKDRGYTLGKRI